MDRKAASFLSLGLLLGIVLSSGLFSLLQRAEASAVSESALGGDSTTEALAPKLVLKIAHVLDQGHPVHVAMEFFKERLREKSKGRVELQIFPNSQLGSETETVEQVQRGALAMAKTSAAPLEGFIPEMGVFSLPYLFRDEDHYWKALTSDVGREIASAGKAVGLRGLCYYDGGARSFYTIEAPILSPADLAGKKIRVMRSKTSMDLIKQLGGAPTPIPWGELYSALQQGMVDGAENNTPSFFSSRHYEVTKHYSLDEHTRIPDIIMFSEKLWQKMTTQQREWVQEAADESTTHQRKIWKESSAKALATLQKAGLKVYHPEKGPFEEKVAPMFARLEGTRVGDLVKRIRAVR